MGTKKCSYVQYVLLCKTLWGSTIASANTLTNTHATITPQPTNNSICLPPDTASFVAALKGRDYFLYFQGNGFYISCVFVNQTSISKKAGGITLISLTVFVKAQQYRLQLLRFPTCLPWEHAFTVVYLQWNKSIKVQRQNRETWTRHVSWHFWK